MALLQANNNKLSYFEQKQKSNENIFLMKGAHSPSIFPAALTLKLKIISKTQVAFQARSVQCNMWRRRGQQGAVLRSGGGGAGAGGAGGGGL